MRLPYVSWIWIRHLYGNPWTLNYNLDSRRNGKGKKEVNNHQLVLGGQCACVFYILGCLFFWDGHQNMLWVARQQGHGITLTLSFSPFFSFSSLLCLVTKLKIWDKSSFSFSLSTPDGETEAADAVLAIEVSNWSGAQVWSLTKLCSIHNQECPSVSEHSTRRS